MRESTFPAAELERERGVLLHEYAEVEDDAMAAAFKLFDSACYGAHPAARPVIGSRANIRRFTRDDLVAWVQQQHTGANVVVGVAGNVDPDQIFAAARRAFASMSAEIASGFVFVALSMLLSGLLLWWIGEETHPRLNPA